MAELWLIFLRSSEVRGIHGQHHLAWNEAVTFQFSWLAHQATLASNDRHYKSVSWDRHREAACWHSLGQHLMPIDADSASFHCVIIDSHLQD